MEKKLGFNEIKNILKSHCQSELGRERVDELTWLTDIHLIRQRQAETQELATLLSTLTERPEMTFYDLRDTLQRIRLEGSYILEEDLPKLYHTLVTLHAWIRLIREPGEYQTEALQKLAEGVFTFLAVQDCAEKILDRHGRIKDEASPELKRLRSELRRAEGSVSRTLQSILQSIKGEGLVEQDVNPTLRDGRLVLPVSPTIKRKLGGIVHDESATGKTVFVEPQAVVEANNHIRELEAQEKREVIRILQHFTMLIRPNVKELLRAFRFLSDLEFVSARVSFAHQIGGFCPEVSSKPIIDWTLARHPLLQQALKSQGRSIIPLDIALTRDKRILIISGPNAGGKSVCLKTVGLIQYMLQCGLPVPLGENSRCGIFQTMMMDIGDDQDIENDLSTYSSHLLHMKQMMKACSPQSLLLIDEFGGGTEPTIGGAMAEAILMRFHEKGSFGIITTHYQNLKMFADSHEGVVNGAMLYDRQKMEALFQLQIGNPGSSFAVEIARKIGIPEDVISDATEIVGKDYVNADKYLLDIVRDKRYWEGKRQTIHSQEKRMEETIQRYEKKMSDLHEKKREIIQGARQEAQQILSETNAVVENTIREIKESQAEKARTQQARQKLEQHKDKLVAADTHTSHPHKAHPQPQHQRSATSTPHIPASAPRNNAPISNTSYVRIKGTTTTGTLDRIEGKKAYVSFGAVTTVVDSSRLEYVGAPKKQQTVRISEVQSVRTRHSLDFNPELDIRGMRADEALDTLMHYMDDALMVACPRVRILHGTGTGALRELVRSYMHTTPHVSNYHDEDVRFGGAGITVVEMK